MRLLFELIKLVIYIFLIIHVFMSRVYWIFIISLKGLDTLLIHMYYPINQVSKNQYLIHIRDINQIKLSVLQRFLLC